MTLIVIGLTFLGLAQLSRPSRGLPLYDGVFVEDPYRYAAPSPGQAGSPGTGESVAQVTGSNSPALAILTSENPPQAQLIVPDNGLAMPTGTTSVTGTLTPLAPTAAQIQAGAVGNIYRMTVTDQAGEQVPLATGATATVILRAPDQNLQVAVARWDGTAFTISPTTTGNQADLLRTQTDTLGDLALVPGPSSAQFNVLLLIGLALLAVAVIGALWLYRRRGATLAATAPARSTPATPRPNKARRRNRR